MDKKESGHLSYIVGFILLIAVCVPGYRLIAAGGEAAQATDAVSPPQSQFVGSLIESSQEGMAGLLDIDNKFFIELARFEVNYDPDYVYHRPLYYKYDDEVQEVLNKIDDTDYHRFVVDSRFRKEVIGPNGNEAFSHDQYYRVLVGPFGEEEAARELNHLVGAGFQDASITQLVKSDDLYPLSQHWLLFLYTKNRGPKFISGWVYLWFDHIEYVIDSKNNRLLFHSLNTYEGDRGGGELFLVDGDDGTMNVLNHTQGFVLLADGRTVLVERSFGFDPKEPLEQGDYANYPWYPVHKLNEDDLAKVAKEIGVAPHEMPIHHVGEGSSAGVSVLFELDLETGESKSLKLFGGQGGIFMMKDGTIYLSNSYCTASYRGQMNGEDRLGIFGARPYYRLDMSRNRLVKLPKDFVPDLNEVAQPNIDGSSDGFTTIAEVGVAKLIIYKGIYLQH